MPKFFIYMVCWVGLMLAVPSWGKYAMPEIQKVPIARLVANLEKQIADNPKQVEPRYALARVYSMAYALKLEQLGAYTNGTPFFGVGGGGRYAQPHEVKPAAGPEQEKEAQSFLKKAVENYQQAVSLDAAHMPSQLGLGWCLDQAGDKKSALGAYRKAIELAWKAESGMQTLEAGAGATEEIAGYMLKLLDPKADAEELKKVRGYQAEMAKKRRWITPILIPLAADLPFTELVNEQAAVEFDLDGSGLPRRWQWLTPKAGWLVYDADGHGEITSGLQLFGSATFWIFWENGYHALAALDNNGDRALTGDELSHLAVWQDVNSDGRCEPGEVQPLFALGIVGLNCRYALEGNILTSRNGVVFADGTTRSSYDWTMQSTP
jgi:tetratricopeptide (TPR) repeat protein